jgi:hypothetical protein
LVVEKERKIRSFSKEEETKRKKEWNIYHNAVAYLSNSNLLK